MPTTPRDQDFLRYIIYHYNNQVILNLPIKYSYFYVFIRFYEYLYKILYNYLKYLINNRSHNYIIKPHFLAFKCVYKATLLKFYIN